MTLAKRHPGPFWLSVLFTILAVVLAVGPNFGGPYDSGLAVLTATLVAVIWYTFFTYCALHRAPAAVVTFGLEPTFGRMMLVRVRNSSSERTVTFCWRVVGRRDGSGIDTGAELSTGKNRLVLRPGEVRELNFKLADPQAAQGSNLGPKVALGEPEELLLNTEVVWRDDLHNTGRIGPDFYAVDVQHLSPRRFQDAKAADSLWSAMGGGDLPRLAV